MNPIITFSSVDMDWREALPLGNGFMGSLTWFRKNRLTVSYNHYDIYYHPLTCSPKNWDTEEYSALYAKACSASKDEPYQTALYGAFAPPNSPGTNLPGAGEVQFLFSPEIGAENQKLSLHIAEAALEFSLQGKCGSLKGKSRILQKLPISVTEWNRDGESVLTGISLSYPKFRPDYQETVTFSQPDSQHLIMEVTFPKLPQKDQKSFSFMHILYLDGVEGILERSGKEAVLRLHRFSDSFRIYSGIFPCLSVKDCLLTLNQSVRDLPVHIAAHTKYWKEQIFRSKINLPDSFLETIWYFDLYLFLCSCGNGGIHTKQTSGLHALWDIRKPTQWQSAWYWDVNIQTSYRPFFTANHPELAKAFCRGFLEHTADIAQYTENFCHAPGLAIDYPHPFYHCIGPWCCQFLWEYYLRTNDFDFLKEIYPVFLGELTYAEHMLKWDENTETYYIFPDISPEQGAITRDSTITIACLKYLLNCTLQAGEILKEKEEILLHLHHLLEHLPAYTMGETTEFGTILCDSSQSVPGMALRHPSLLMPIYPIGEWNLNSPEEIRQWMKNTVCYTREKTEYGTFGFSWIACAAARTGDGDLALDTLYRLGIDLHLRPNGMPAEETDRWRNFCLVHKAPRYYPTMQEAAGGTMSVINEMFFQFCDKEIRIFPAAPSSWQSCGFEGFLAPGGFRISAARRSGKTVWIQAESLYGKPLRLRIPETLSDSGKEESLSMETKAGGLYTWGKPPKEPSRDFPDLPLHITHTGQRLFLGKNCRTAFLSEIDDFLRDKFLANTHLEQQLASLYLFGDSELNLPPALDGCKTPVTRVSQPTQYTDSAGFGFLSSENILSEPAPKNFPFSGWFRTNGKVTFCLDLPKSRYAVLVCGIFSANTLIAATAEGFYTESCAGRHHGQGVSLYLPLQEDSLVELTVSKPCKLCGIFLKRIS